MRRWFTGSTLLLGFLFAVTIAAADDKQDGQDKDSPPKSTSKSPAKDKKDPKPKANDPNSLQFIGKIIQVEGAQRYITVQVTFKIPQQNLGAAQNLASLQQQRINAIRNKDVNALNNIAIEMAKNQEQLITYKDETKNVELQAAEDMKVRTLLLPVEFDEKGKIRKLTAKELKELKGPDPKLKGYQADFDNLKPGQVVEVHLAKPKIPARPKSKAKNKDKEDDVPADKEKPKVLMIVIQYEPPK